MKKILAACAIAAAAVLGVAAPANAVVPPDDVINNVDPDLNKPSYWANYTPENDVCVKREFQDGVKSGQLPALPAGYVYTLLVIKAGTQYTVYEDPTTGISYSPANGKDISFGIACYARGSYTPPPPPVS